MEALGFIAYWGFTPSINFFTGTQVSLDDDSQEINVLVSECSDMRHILRSLAESLPLESVRQKKINIFIHEK
jgi:hypothetical protein